MLGSIKHGSVLSTFFILALAGSSLGNADDITQYTFSYKDCPWGPSELREQDKATMCCSVTEEIEGLRSSECYYRPASTGADDYGAIIGEGNSRIVETPWNNDPSKTIIKLDGDVISWWFKDLASSKALGRYMFQKDMQQLSLKGKPRIQIIAAVAKVETLSDEEIGFELGAFYGRRDYPEKDNNFVGTISQVAQSFLQIGNPLTSFLKIGFKNIKEKYNLYQIEDISASCPQYPARCDFNKEQRVSIEVGSSSPRVETLQTSFGASMTATRPNEESPYTIKFSGLNINYTERTGEIPTNVNSRPNIVSATRTFSLVNNQLAETIDGGGVVLARQSFNSTEDSSTVGTRGKKQQTSKFVVFIRAAVNRTLDASEWDNRAYTQADLDALSTESTTLEEMFKTMEFICFENKFNPFSDKPVCGLRFTKLDTYRKDLFFKFEVKGDNGRDLLGARRFHISRELKHAADGTRSLSAGDLYVDHGYYQFPQFKPSGSGQEFTLEISALDPSLLKPEDRVRKMYVKFRYFSEARLPIAIAPGVRFLGEAPPAKVKIE